MRIPIKRLLLAVSLVFSASAWAKQWTLGLNWKAEPEFGGFYTALQEGFYKNEKLDVKILEGGSGTPTVQMLAQGKIDFAIVSADEILLSYDRDPKNPLVPLFAVFQKSPYVIMTHAEKKYKNLKEVFADKSALIAVQAGLPYFKFLSGKWGNPQGKVVPYAGGVGAFLKETQMAQQGFVSIEPLVAEKSGASVKSFLIADEGFNPYLVVLAVHQKTWDTQKEVVQRFVSATKKGWEMYLLNPEKTNKKMATLNKALDLAAFEKGAQIQKSLIQHLHLGTMEARRWDELAKQLKDLGLIKTAPQGVDLIKTF